MKSKVTLWLAPEAIAAWTPRRSGTRGGQRRYSDLAIETAWTLRLIYPLPLRQAEGFLNSLFTMMTLDLSVPDDTTLSRRGQRLKRRLRPVTRGESIHLILDSTALSIVGEGEWAAAKYGSRSQRGWKKLHLGVDGSGVIVAQALTAGHGDDATTGIDLIEAVDGDITRVTADATYDTVAFYGAACARRDRRGVPGQVGEHVSTETAVARARSHDSAGQDDRTPSLEDGVWLPSAGSRGERVLPVQVDRRTRPSSAQSSRAADRGRPRVQYPQSDD